MRSASKSTNLNNEKGITTVLMAVVIFVLVFFVGMAVDFGYMYVVKGQLQNAADAGALAGAANLNPYDTLTFTQAKQLAKEFAEKNKAAGTLLTEAVALNLLKNDLAPDNDVTIGNWDPVRYPEKPYDTNRTPYNAVQVRVRRTSDNPNPAMGQIDIFFSKVFGWSKMSTAAEAIADAEPAPLLPIAVNEYWLQDKGPSLRPYGALHDYPHSFVRRINVDGSSNTDPSTGTFGKVFGIMGANADDNIPAAGALGSKDMNGFVNLDARSSRHDGNIYPDGTPSWYLTGPTLSGCDGLSGPMTYNTGFISSAKFDESLGYLFNGYLSSTYAVPDAVKEQFVSPYPDNSASQYLYNVDPPLTPTTSFSPYATVTYFPSSGAQPLNKTFNGEYFKDKYPKGKKVITMVYDGTFESYADPNMPNAVTNVGYVLLEIDGYSSGNPKQLANNPNFLGTSGNTAYAHVPGNVAEPFVEPSSIGPGTCDSTFLNRLNRLFYAGATPKLVK